jgi:hypothetical protein
MSDTIRELDQRTGHGVTVSLLWNAETDCVFVSVVEERNLSSFEFEVPGADAAEAFHHPYAYASYSPGGLMGRVTRQAPGTGLNV